MSIHFSRYLLNTYSGTAYFAAHVPPDYPLSLVLQKCRAFRRLPANLRRLSGLAKRWAQRNGGVPVGIGEAYDSAGNELDPATGVRLTDAQIDAQWSPDPSLDGFEVEDIPEPAGGFADPVTWRPEVEADPDAGDDGPSEAQILADIESHGRARAAAEYGVSAADLATVESDKDLAQLIVSRG